MRLFLAPIYYIDPTIWQPARLPGASLPQERLDITAFFPIMSFTVIPPERPKRDFSLLPAPETLQVGFETYLSPFTYRYGSDEMKRIWSQKNMWLKARDVWIATAEVQHEAGLVTAEEVADLKRHREELSVERVFQWERDPDVGTGHDIQAAIKEYSEVAQLGGRILHYGLTSEDVLSNVEMSLIHESFGLIRPKLVGTLDAFSGQIEKHKGLICMGYTHLQAAEPTTMGYRFAKYAQELLLTLQYLDVMQPFLKGKGIRGPVGTSASSSDILKDTGMSAREHEQKIMEKLHLDSVLVSDQTYPRTLLFYTESVLAAIGQALHHYALNLQVLQSTFVGEVSEPRRKGQTGSSAMPHKQNPIHSENIDALTETLPGSLFSAWMGGAFVTLERTLRDSAGKRSWLPESFLIADEALMRAERVTRGLKVHENAVETNLKKFAPFSASEIVLQKLIEAGMDRVDAHELLVAYSEKALEHTREGRPNFLRDLILGDEKITTYLDDGAIREAFYNVYKHTGDAEERCERFLAEQLYPAIQAAP
ncbi:adenylosuccinate lyase [Candidatus Roizmanbacteria bacterium]|nr:adenylosuccinate lyase [Candidatus Roizmanbacteria bacterium]